MTELSKIDELLEKLWAKLEEAEKNRWEREIRQIWKKIDSALDERNRLTKK